MAIEVLAALEDALARASATPGTLLADHFDLVAGTSAGAIVASAIALRIPMAEIRDFVEANTRSMFQPSGWLERIRHLYDKRQLERNLRTWFGEDTALGSDRLRTLLMLVMRNASTDSPWIVSNSPRAPFNRRDLDDCNLDLKVWQLARASAAAPGYFEPEVVTLDRTGRHRFVFVDGGLTGFNNPAFKAFLFATTEPYGLGWEAGEDRLVVVSVGTGGTRRQDPLLQPARMHHWYTMWEVPRALMLAADREQDVLCRTFGRCLAGDPIDLEVGDLRDARTAVDPKLFTYFRINAQLTPEGLTALGCGHIDPVAVSPLDGYRHVAQLQEIGRALASCHVTGALVGHLLR
jgi:hypothetical protein